MTLDCTTLPAPATNYALGASPILTAVYTDPTTGALADPTTVIAKVRKADGTTTTYTSSSVPAISNPSVGTYQLVLPVTTVPGDWFYRFEASGSLTDAAETRFHVLGSAFTAPVAVPPSQWISGLSLASDKRLIGVKLPPEVTLDDIIQTATRELFLATAQRYRVRTVLNDRPNQIAYGCGCWSDCCCGGVSEIALPPQSTVLDVTVDGVVLSPTAYELYNGTRLVRQDGGLFACCQPLQVPLGQPGTWSVSYSWGELPPIGGMLACRILSIHEALIHGGQESKAPENADTRGRGGATINLNRGKGWKAGQPMEFGIPSVDRWVRSENPRGATRRASVSSPDTIDSAVPSI